MRFPVRSLLKGGRVSITVTVLQDVHLRKIENKVGKLEKWEGERKERKGEEGQKGDG